MEEAFIVYSYWIPYNVSLSNHSAVYLKTMGEGSEWTSRRRETKSKRERDQGYTLSDCVLHETTLQESQAQGIESELNAW